MVLSLSEIKHIEFEILCHFKETCEKNHIRYFLSNGTLLGAIKYKGFIPWDDDIDVFVPRDDYERLIQTYQDGEKYQLFSYERNKNYRFTYAKLCDMSTVKEEGSVNNGIRLGLDIDIFPLDDWPKGKEIYMAKKMNAYCIAQALSKRESLNGKNILKKMIIFVCKKIGWNFFTKRMINLVKKMPIYPAPECKGCVVWPIYGVKEIIPERVFRDSKKVEFEGEFFDVPIGYDTYLRKLYGDYSKELPIEEQCTHHSFKAYWR